MQKENSSNGDELVKDLIFKWNYFSWFRLRSPVACFKTEIWLFTFKSHKNVAWLAWPTRWPLARQFRSSMLHETFKKCVLCLNERERIYTADGLGLPESKMKRNTSLSSNRGIWDSAGEEMSSWRCDIFAIVECVAGVIMSIEHHQFFLFSIEQVDKDTSNEWTKMKTITKFFRLLRRLQKIWRDVLILNDLCFLLQSINSIFEAQGWDFEVVSGEIRSVTVGIPWNCLMSEDSFVEVDSLRLCLRPQPRAKDDGKYF